MKKGKKSEKNEEKRKKLGKVEKGQKKREKMKEKLIHVFYSSMTIKIPCCFGIPCGILYT